MIIGDAAACRGLDPAGALLELRKFVAPEFVFGPGAADLAGRYARNLGLERALVVTDPGVIEAGWTGRTLDALRLEGLEYVVFSDVSPNPRDEQVMAGAAFFASQGCDGIVAVGGGSPMDCAKGIAIVSSHDRNILEFEGVDKVERPSPPLICCPTTAGSSADVSQFAIITDTTRKVKVAIVSKATVPDTALVDPVLTTTMDRELTVNTGLDALTHAVEAYVSNANAPVTDLFALEAVRLISANLDHVADDLGNLELRAKVMLGSMYAGLAFSNAILGAVHAMAHSLGGLKDLPHGQCNAILLDHVMAYNFAAQPERYKAIGRAMGAVLPPGMPDAEARDVVLDAVRGFKRTLGMTATLSDLGVTEADLDRLAAMALQDPCMATNPVCPDCVDVAAIYRSAL